MNFSATVPASRMDEANAAMELAGFGPGNFSVPIKGGGATAANVAGLHCWSHPEFQAAIEALGYATVDVGDGKPNFDAMLTKGALEWVQPFGAEDPNIKKVGDRVTTDGKTWESLIDNNVWQPPVGWREVVAVGNPAWVQPTGAHDAYALGSRVSFNGANYESVISANVWSPAVYPAGWKKI